MLWHEDIKEKRKKYGISQKQLANLIGVSTEYLCRIEKGKKNPSENTKRLIEQTIEKFNPDYSMYILMDYVRIRFNTHDTKDVIEKVLKIKPESFDSESRGWYGYRTLYSFGNIFVLEAAAEDERQTLLELKGHGCREFEVVLEAQGRSWIDFFGDCVMYGCVFKRIDIAINDVSGILSIPDLIKKCESHECSTIFKSSQSNVSQDMIKKEILDGKTAMGNTLYLGSMHSDIYFCIYEKDFEQYKKEGIPIEEAEIKNRFELRLKNDRALIAVEDLFEFQDIEKTAFEIINRYIVFLEPDADKDIKEWEMDNRWSWLMGNGRGRLKLTVQPEPYSFERTTRWLVNDAFPSLKAAMYLESMRGSTYLEDAFNAVPINKKHQKMIRQEGIPIEDLLVNDLPLIKCDLPDIDDVN